MPVTMFSLTAIPTKLAISALAGLAVGTGALGVYLAQPTPVAASVIAAPVADPGPAPPIGKTAVEASIETPAAPANNCAQQTWPYIGKQCAVDKGTWSPAVRVVLAPRGETTNHIAAPQAAIEEANKALALVSRDTVLRAPELLAKPKVAKPHVKRAEKPRVTRERRWAAQSYQVPSEARQGNSQAIMVVRPLRTDSFD
jgi:hypothetical protein